MKTIASPLAIPLATVWLTSSLLSATEVSGSPSQLPLRHSYDQLLELVHGSAHGRDNAVPYGFEDARRAADYRTLTSGDDSPTWHEEMAIRVHADTQQKEMRASGRGDDKPKPGDQRGPFPPWSWGGSFNGLQTFAHLPPVRCTTEDRDTKYDVAILGAPFDTATSYRPGARFGPKGIRSASQFMGGLNPLQKVDPFREFKAVDCGDSRMTFYSNDVALRTLEKDYADILNRTTATHWSSMEPSITRDGVHRPRILMLGGDHTIVLPALRSLYPHYGPMTVLHFDSHCDSRHPRGDPVTHGDYFYFAAKEGLLTNRSMHVGIRVACDLQTDAEVGFSILPADAIEDIGYNGVIQSIKDRVGDSPIYLTFDIDTLDPAFAPGTGTPAIGGLTTREVKKILNGLSDLMVIGADIVEVSPAYDTQAEVTSLAGAGLAYEMLSMMAKSPPVKKP